jgi:murein L,D-transpeptidase YafK
LRSTQGTPRLRAFGRFIICALALVLTAGEAAAQRMLIREFLPSPVPMGEDRTTLAAAFTASDLFASDFLNAQLRHQRVLAARIETRFGIKQMFEARGIEYPAAEIFLRVFKRERVLELWVRPHGERQFAMLKSYGICALAGEPGPKRRQGDNQTPEGFYEINHFNPNSAFHLSLHINYPNRSDRLLANGGPLGGDIFIHGGCQTEGCIAVTDEGIKELYWMGVEARAAGQRVLPIHIFPFRLTDEDLAIAANVYTEAPALIRFWQSLQAGYEHFERTRTLPAIGVDARGYYALQGTAAPGNGTDPRMLLGRPVTGGQD